MVYRYILELMSVNEGAGSGASRQFFVSYTSPDEAWATWIAWQIEQHDGWHAVVQAWDFGAGANFVLAMDDALRTSDVVLSVMSAQYMDSAFAASEWASSFRNDPQGLGRRLVPIRVEDISIDGLFGPIIYVDLVGVDEVDARNRLISELSGERRKPLQEPAFPGHQVPETCTPVFPGDPTSNVGMTTRGEVPPLVTETVLALDENGVIADTAKWVLNDQLRETGGWGSSQAAVMSAMTGEELSSLERREGGIISTFVALRGLLAYEGDMDLFQSRSWANRARRYLTDRQANNGGFGRFVRSRSGEEIHPSVRHSSFAVRSLLDLGGPQSAIEDGLTYIRASLDRNWWTADASPSLALAGVIGLSHRLGSARAMDDTARSSETLAGVDTGRLARELGERAHRSPDNPFWEPYGGHPDMVYDTALSVIDLLPDPVPPTLQRVVRGVLVTLVLHRNSDGGLSYGPGQPASDIGMSAFLLSTLLRRTQMRDFNASRPVTQLLQDAVAELTAYLLGSWACPSAWTMTYCDTLANLLLLAPSIHSERNRAQRSTDSD